MTETLTPMMQQYQRLKREVPGDAILLFRLGDFYEMFFEDATIGSQILNIALTQRQKIPMCGIPFHAAENYIAKIIKAGRRVAICDQTEEATPGKLVNREVKQIISPGSVVENTLLEARRNSYLAGISTGKGKYGFAVADLTTGEFRVAEFLTERDLIDELTRLTLAEVVVPQEWRDKLNGMQLPFVITLYDDWCFEYDTAFHSLKNHFKVQSLDGFGCELMTAGIGAAGAIVHYLENTLRRNIDHIQVLRPYSSQQFMVVDHVTRRNLELVEPASQSGKNTTLLGALDRTITPMGARLMREWITHPLSDIEAIRERHSVVAAFLNNTQAFFALRDALKPVRDMERIIGRMCLGNGNARDIQALRDSLIALPVIKQLVGGFNLPLMIKIEARIHVLPHIIDLVNASISDEPPLALKEGGIIRQGYNAELDELYTATRDGKEWIAQLQLREQDRTGIKSLKIRFNSVFGYYIEISSSNLKSVPSDYTRKQTMVNGERFITPELKEMEGKILGAEERSRKLEYELFIAIRQQICGSTAMIQECGSALSELDVLSGFAEVARMQNYVQPVMSVDGALNLKESRHPVLEQISVEERFIPNDVLLDKDNCRLVILTGPNMAGKSTYIRQVALLALMAHMGSFVPAQSAEVGILDRIFTRVGANDDLSRGQSTFMVEMNETANILNNATARSLVILDEIGRGTSTFDGLSIAWAVAEHLHNVVQAKTLFATHYHELTELCESLPATKNFHVAVREWNDKIIFLRKINPGGTDKSYGIQVGRLAGLPQSVIERAKTILCSLEDGELNEEGQSKLAASSKKKREAGAKIPPTSQLDMFSAGKKK